MDNSKSYDVDHIHPKSIFTSNQIKEISFSTDEDKKLALDGITYDKIVNLELLEYDLNRSKNKKQFESCLDQADDAYKDFFIKNHFMDGLQLKIQDFGTFVEGRKERLQKVLVDFL